MTTAWANLVHGHPLRALDANLGGTILAALAMLIAPWALVSAARGAWAARPPRERTLVIVAAAIVAITLLDWLGRLL